MLEMYFLMAVFCICNFIYIAQQTSPKVVSDKVKKKIKRNARSKLSLYVTLLQNAKERSRQESMQDLNVYISLDLWRYMLL